MPFCVYGSNARYGVMVSGWDNRPRFQFGNGSRTLQGMRQKFDYMVAALQNSEWNEWRVDLVDRNHGEILRTAAATRGDQGATTSAKISGPQR